MERMSIQSTTRKRRNGLAAFRAVEPDVREALSAGRTLVAIYEELAPRLGLSYEQFTRYARPFRAVTTMRTRTAREAARTFPPIPAGGREQAPTTGPPKGRPEDAVPKLDMDGFATKALNNKDLF
jgi:Family of unknown function (DUF5338)